MTQTTTSRHAHAQSGLIPGFTLIELMVGLTIGSFLVIGATSVYLQGRRSFQDNESISRLHEDARYALAAIEPDIRMAGFYGMQPRADLIQNSAGPADPEPAGLGVVVPNCGKNWVVDLGQPIGGTNNGYDWDCAPKIGAARAGSDTLVVRRVAENPLSGSLQPNRLYVQTTRGPSNALFLGGGGAPFTTATGVEAIHELITHGYYVSTASNFNAALPSLRRWSLAPGPQLIDEEILSGVEDLQIEFGVDTDDPGAPTRGSINRYIASDDPILIPDNPAYDADAQVLAVRLWLLVRGTSPEPGYTDSVFAYSDRDWGGPVAPANVRRLLVSKTIFLRNVRTNNND